MALASNNQSQLEIRAVRRLATWRYLQNEESFDGRVFLAFEPIQEVQPGRLLCPYACGRRAFTSIAEIKKHVQADHDKSVRYTCAHSNCSWESYRGDKFGQHHQTHTLQNGDRCDLRSCRKSQLMSRKKRRTCGICPGVVLDGNFHVWWKHYTSHIPDGELTAFDPKPSFRTVLKNLLNHPIARRLMDEHELDVSDMHFCVECTHCCALRKELELLDPIPIIRLSPGEQARLARLLLHSRRRVPKISVGSLLSDRAMDDFAPMDQ